MIKNIRKKKRNFSIILNASHFSIIVLILLCILITVITKKFPIYIAVFSVTVYSFFTGIIYILSGYNEREFKEIIRNIFEKYDLVYVSSPSDYTEIATPSKLKEKNFISSLIPYYYEVNCYERNDLVLGKRGDIDFQSVDINYGIREKLGKNNNNSANKHLFSGRFYLVELPLEKDFKLIITEDELRNADGFNEIFFESINADKKYRFFTNDEHRAFYYVKPKIIEGLIKLEEKYSGCLMITISKGNLYAAHTDYFPFELGIETTEETIEIEIQKELEFIDSLIELFNY